MNGQSVCDNDEKKKGNGGDNDAQHKMKNSIGYRILKAENDP